MLTNNQSLLLCGLMVGIFFIAGLLDALDNFVVKSILTIIFLAIIVNLISAKTISVKEEEVEIEAEE